MGVTLRSVTVVVDGSNWVRPALGTVELDGASMPSVPSWLEKAALNSPSVMPEVTPVEVMPTPTGRLACSTGSAAVPASGTSARLVLVSVSVRFSVTDAITTDSVVRPMVSVPVVVVSGTPSTTVVGAGGGGGGGGGGDGVALTIACPTRLAISLPASSDRALPVSAGS